MTDLDSDLQRVFRDELAESLDRLAAEFESLQDGGQDPSAGLSSAMHVAHNLKGAARVAGFEPIVQVAHAMEDVLSALAAAQQSPAQSLVKILVTGVALLESLAASKASEEETSTYVEDLRGALDELDLAVPEKPGSGIRIARAAERPEAPQQGEAAPSEGGRENSVRVTVGRLDRLMAATGEMLTFHSRQQTRSLDLESLRTELEDVRRSVSGPVKEQIEAFSLRVQELQWVRRRDLRQLGYLAEDVRMAMRRVRMVPLTAMLPQWRRIVREAARDAGKEVRFETAVDDVELDRRILEEISDPLMHLLRNAVGHGIEPAEERERRGKPGPGSVQLRAEVRGSRVRLQVSDDGHGIHRQRVLDLAQDKGLLEPGKASHLSVAEIQELLFSPGFSTAQGVGELSGRGFGLDIVRQRIRALGGRAELARSPRLGGATFELEVPVTLVSTRGLLVGSANLACAIPVDSIERTLRIDADEVKTVDGGAAVKLEEGPLRLHWLSTAMGQRRKADPPLLTLVVVVSGERRLGLVVEDIRGEEDFVAKSLPWNLRSIPGVSGAVILGDGSISVVLDIPDLIRNLEGRHKAETLLKPRARRRPNILVVDDSLTSRTLERNILESAGYDVTTCQDGEQAWQQLQKQPVDLLVTDVQMPGLNGFELTRRLRADDRLGQLPVVVVSSLGSPEELAEGASAGADDYIVKGQFDQRKLLQAVERLVT